MLGGTRDHHEATYVNDFLKNKKQIENVPNLKKQRKLQPKNFAREQSMGWIFSSQNNLPKAADQESLKTMAWPEGLNSNQLPLFFIDRTYN